MKNIKVNITDVLTPQVKYEGLVKIFYIDKSSGKPKIIHKHNSGGSGLFSAICRMLIGLDSSEYIPQTIMGYIDKESKIKAFTQFLGYASTPILYTITTDKGGNISEKIAQNVDEANAVQYTFMIPSANLVNHTETIKQLHLYNRQDMMCAELNLDESEEISMSTNSNILIYWKLKFE